ncbi:cytochrome P450 [Hyaloraphidium curvatum]|nr:cytochrome P450 [Hyaloraphidium curvatum]
MELLSALALAIATLLFLRTLSAVFRSPLSHLPGPWWSNTWFISLPVLLAQGFRGKRHETAKGYVARYGPVVRSLPNMVIVADPEIAKAALAQNGWPKDPAIYRADRQGARSLFSHIDPDQHKALRRKLSPAFSIRSLNSIEPIVLEVVRDFLDKLGSFADAGGSVDILKMYGLFTGDVIGEVAFGERWGMVKQGHSEVLEHAERMVRTSMFANFLGRLLPYAYRYVKTVREGIESALFMERYSLKVVKDRRSGKTGPREDLLQRMCDAVDPETGDKLTDDEVAVNCTMLIVAGDETTAHQLSFATYQLLLNPEKLSALRAEVDAAAKQHYITRSDLLTNEMLKDLPYINAVINESLRLLPTTFYITRRIVPEPGFRHPTDPRIFIPPGVSCTFANGLMARDKAVFGPDADHFVPERWIGEKGIKEADVKFSWLPFSRGSRNCIGSGLALIELRVLLANVVRAFDLALVRKDLLRGRPLDVRTYLTSAPAAGELEVRVSRRS